MSFDKFIQTRTIAKTENLPSIPFPLYKLSSFIEFETDGYLVGVHFMFASAADDVTPGAVDYGLPNGAIVAKVSGDQLSLPPGGTTTNFSGAQVLISTLDYPDNSGTTTSANRSSRQTTIAYDADSKRIPIKSNDSLGVYLCSNASFANINFAYTLTAYFVRS
jgi:hypothetical protein